MDAAPDDAAADLLPLGETDAFLFPFLAVIIEAAAGVALPFLTPFFAGIDEAAAAGVVAFFYVYDLAGTTLGVATPSRL